MYRCCLRLAYSSFGYSYKPYYCNPKLDGTYNRYPNGVSVCTNRFRYRSCSGNNLNEYNSYYNTILYSGSGG